MPLSVGSPLVRDGETILATGFGVGRRPNRSYSTGRICAVAGCDTRLSIYNPDIRCSIHEGAATDEVPQAGQAA